MIPESFFLAQATQPTTQQVTEPVWNSVWTALTVTAEQTTWRGWLALLGGILAGVIVGYFVKKLLLGINHRLLQRAQFLQASVFAALAGPAGWLLLVVGISAGLGSVAMADLVRFIVARFLALSYIIGFGWLTYNLIDVFHLVLQRVAGKTANNLDDQMVPLVRKALRIFLLIVIALFILNNVFNRDVSAWLAGLGIAGLAISFAAQDTIRNFFGSLTILFDRPFQLGDTVILDTHEGTIEDIGFRSIRLRRADGVLVTIPNSKVVDQSIQNQSRRDALRRIFTIAIVRGTPPDKLERALEIIRDVLADPAITAAMDPLKTESSVNLEELVPGHHYIKVTYWFRSRNPSAFASHAEQVNLMVMKRLGAEGIQLA